MTFDQIITTLHQLGTQQNIALKEKKFGIIANNALGVYLKDLKEIAKIIGYNNDLAVQLFNSGIYEARILCSKIFDPKDLTETLMEQWVVSFENWEICDAFCMGLFARGPFAVTKAKAWSLRENEFEKRASFAIIAAYCMADKNAENKIYEQFLPIIKREAHDQRIYVKKALSWALRNIGKRNKDLNKKAIEVAEALGNFQSKSAKWIANDALRELKKENVNILDYPRKIYRTA